VRGLAVEGLGFGVECVGWFRLFLDSDFWVRFRFSGLGAFGL